MEFTNMYNNPKTYDWKFSTRSLKKITGVKLELYEVTKLALNYSEVDFGVTCGLRTKKEQRMLVDSGRSQTMKSKHLTGDAVDVVAYLGPKAVWDLPLYCKIADAFKLAAIELDVAVRWGSAWTVSDIRNWNGTMESAQEEYISIRKSQGRKPFLDGPHFELA